MAGSASPTSDPNPVGFGWNEDRLRASIADGWSGIPQAKHPNCLDMGQTNSWTQFGQDHFGIAGLCADIVAKGVAVLLVGDCEFGSVEVLRQLELWRWDYVLRQKNDTHVCLAQETEWRDFGSYAFKAGQSFWLGAGWLTESKIHYTNLLIHWKIGEKEPWCLATNLPDQQMALKAYARRMWIEEMFGDLKRHGFDLESTMLHSFVRLSLLTLAVVLL